MFTKKFDSERNENILFFDTHISNDTCIYRSSRKKYKDIQNVWNYINKENVPCWTLVEYIFLKRFYSLIFREWERGRNREKETSMCVCHLSAPLGTWPTTQACAPTGNGTSDPLVHRPALNPLSHTGQGRLSLFEVYNVYIKLLTLKYELLEKISFRVISMCLAIIIFPHEALLSKGSLKMSIIW